MSFKSRFCAISALSFFLSIAFMVQAQAALTSDQCDLTTGHPLDRPVCPTSNPNLAVALPTYDAARADPGMAGPPIDVWNFCRYVDNYGTNSLFVPFRTSPEWVAFVNHREPGLTLVTCSRPGSVNVPSDYPTYPNPTGLQDLPLNPWYNAELACDTGQEISVSLAYARTGTTITSTEQFTCTVKGLCDDAAPPNCGADQNWQLTATATLTAGVAPDSAATPVSGGWMLTNVVYAGTKPPPNPAPTPIDGQCGSANGTPVSAAPSSELCAVGAASAVNGSGPWTWTCAGSNGGTDANCSAPVTCGGTNIGGYCFYLDSAPGWNAQSCNAVCGSHGGCNSPGLVYANSNQCYKILQSLNAPQLMYGTSFALGNNSPLGCIEDPKSAADYFPSTIPTCAASGIVGPMIVFKHICACNN